jgi:hypothetical protein
MPQRGNATPRPAMERPQRERPRLVLLTPTSEPAIRWAVVEHSPGGDDDAAASEPGVRPFCEDATQFAAVENRSGSGSAEAVHTAVRHSPRSTSPDSVDRCADTVAPHVRVMDDHDMVAAAGCCVADGYSFAPRVRGLAEDHTVRHSVCDPLQRGGAVYAAVTPWDQDIGHGSCTRPSPAGSADQYHSRNRSAIAASPLSSRMRPHSRQCAPKCSGRSDAA